MPDLKRAATVGASLVAALGMAVPLVQHWEGLRTQPYRDVTGLPTVCYGDTKDVQAHTEAECSVLLVARMAHDYAPAVVKCVPALADKPSQLAASLSLSWNIGTGAFCRSTAARRFNAGQWASGCDAFLMWNRAGGHIVAGLTNRRKAERELCRSGL